MDCGRYSAAIPLEVLLDEGDFRSFSRTREYGCFLHVAHNCMWQSKHAKINVYFLELSEQTEWTDSLTSLPFLFDLRLRFRLRLCLSLNVQQTLEHNSG